MSHHRSVPGRRRSIVFAAMIAASSVIPMAAAGPDSADPGTEQIAKSAPSMSPGKMIREARRAYKERKLEEALRLYEAFIAVEPLATSDRGEALYYSGMLRLQPDPDLRDVPRARKSIQTFLAAYPKDERAFHVAVVANLLDEIAAAGRQAAQAGDEIARRDQVCAADKEKIRTEIAAARSETEAVRDDVSDLKAENQDLRAAVQRLRAQLQQKQDSLDKVKDALVGSRSGSRSKKHR